MYTSFWQRQSLRPLRLSILLLAFFWVAALSQAGLAGAGETPLCDDVQAIFFDLGDTLVELDGGSGLFVLKPGASETIAQLQALGVRLGVITNVPSNWELADLQAVLEEPEFLDEFEVVVLSSQAPASKPDPAIYLHAHGLMIDPPPITQTAFVGETLGEIADGEPATEGAKAVGMVGIHLTNAAPSPLADYTVSPDNLPGVTEIVESFGRPVFCDGFESGDLSSW